MKTENPFRRADEQRAYELLHRYGLDAFEEQHPVFGTDLINRWCNKGIMRLTWTDDGRKIRTFKKYAEGRFFA